MFVNPDVAKLTTTTKKETLQMLSKSTLSCSLVLQDFFFLVMELFRIDGFAVKVHF